MRGRTFTQGAQAAIPTALGYLSIGLACGIIGAAYMNPLEMALMSILIYAGSAQFAFIALLGVAATTRDIVLTVFLINLRMSLMSLHASSIFQKESLLNNIGIGTLLTDESYGVLMAESIETSTIRAAWMHGNNVMSYSSWILGTVLGATVGSLLPDPQVFGLDFALVGMFVGIFVSQFQAMARRFPLRKIGLVLLVVGLSFFVLTSLVSQSLAVLFATLLGCLVGVTFDD